MRKILFKGQDRYTRTITGSLEWVKGDLVQIDPDCTFISVDDPEWGEMDIEVISDTVGQFSGELDKNGKDIFEGDILFDPLLGDFYVAFEDAKFVMVPMNQVLRNNGERLDLHSRSTLFTIEGNIHDLGDEYKEEDGQLKSLKYSSFYSQAAEEW